MSLHFVFRNLESTDALKEHITKKTDKFRKIVSYPLDVHITLKVDKLDHEVEITCHAEHRQLAAHARTRDLYESIDGAVTKMEIQLRKERDLKKGHKTAHKASRPSSLKEAKDVDGEIPHKEKKTPQSD